VQLEIPEEVQAALNEGKAVVGLESTVISHGLPFPDNLETAKKMEAAVRKAGAVPATVGVLNGKIVAGLSGEEIERFAQEKGIFKVSRRDFGPVLAQKARGATTVAATAIVCAAAGIRVFATGGIGGVHRGAAHTFDISADLTELSQSPVAVVCAGPKAVLDIGLTLEVLETLGVPVVGFKSATLPAFYSQDSGFTLEYSYDTAQELALMLATHWRMGMKSGVLITNPPPAEVALERLAVEAIIADALAAAAREQIRGKAVTPFLLSYLSSATKGKTLAVNKALLLNNAAAAAEIAVALAGVTDH
jgi:pseudouridine-5'-phosphate glycosidase